MDASLQHISCKCKRPKCKNCSLCSRCGCSCDGLAIQVKLNRKRGGVQPANASTISGKRKRSSPSLNLELLEDGLLSDGTKSGDRHKTSCVQELVRTNGDISIASLKGYFELSSTSTKNLPSAKQRKDVATYEELGASGGRLTKFCNTIVSKLCQLLVPNDPTGLMIALSQSLNPNNETRNTDLLESMIAAQNALGVRSVQRKVLLAPLCASQSLKMVRSCIPSLGKMELRTGRANYRRILCGKELKPVVRSVARYNTTVVQNVVKFILSPSNIRTLSWGTNTFVVDDQEITLPRFTRTKIKEYIYRDYLEREVEAPNRVSYGAFMKLLASLTSFDERSRKAVDYASGILLYDNLELLGKLVNTIEDDCKRSLCQKACRRLELFMKYEFVDEHLSTNQSSLIPSHSASIALREQHENNEHDNCNTCQIPFQAFHLLRYNLSNTHHDILSDSEQKAKLLMGHLLRVHNQRKRIQQLHDHLQTHDAMLVMDYKMKYEPVYFREKTVEHYGKRGMSWHGTMIYTIGSDMTKKISYLDHISTGDSKQDWKAVLSIFEGILIHLKDKFPFVKRLYVQSDNAKCYQNGKILLGIMLLCKEHALELGSFVHTETQDGKGLIDAHFAVAMALVMTFVNMGNNVISPRQLFYALQSNGGLSNTEICMFTINRDEVTKLTLHEYQDAFDQFAKIKRLNEATIEGSLLHVYDYSGIDPIIINISSLKKPVFPNTQIYVDYDENVAEEVTLDYVPNVDSVQDEVENTEDFEPYENESITIAPVTRCTFVMSTAGNNLPRSRRQYSKRKSKCGNVYIVKNGIRARQRKSKHNENSNQLQSTNLQNNERSILDILTPQSDTEDDMQDSNITCVVCTKTFASTIMKHRHVCRGARPNNDMLSVALRYADKLIRDGEIDFLQTTVSLRQQSASTLNDEVQLAFAGIHDTFVKQIFSSGWAKRPSHGKIYGAKYIGKFKDEIRDMFLRGTEDNMNKLGPGRMLETLKKRYSNRFDLPSETEIRQYITTLNAKYKTHGSLEVQNRGVPEPYRSSIIQIVVESSYQITPALALRQFKEQYPDLNDKTIAPTDVKIKSLVSSVKSKFKQQGIRL